MRKSMADTMEPDRGRSPSRSRSSSAKFIPSLEAICEGCWAGSTPFCIKCGRGMELLEQAAELGEPEALCQMGKRAKKLNNMDEAIEWFNKAVAAGDAGALFELGKLYFLGDGVEENIEKAKEYFDKALEKGHDGINAYLDKDDDFARTSVRKKFRRMITAVDVSALTEGIYVQLPFPARIGFLYKRASVKKKDKWQKRLVCLCGPFLSYIRDPCDCFPANRINVRTILSVEMIESKEDFLYTFAVKTADREFEFYSDSKRTVDEWVDSIQKMAAFYLRIHKTKVFLEDELEGKEGSQTEISWIDLPPGHRYSPEISTSALRSGWLSKKSEKSKSWSKKWVVLTKNTLFFFKGDEEIDTGIPLENASVLIARDALGLDKKNTICLVTMYQNVFLQVANSEEMASWLSAFRRAVDSCTKRKVVKIDDLMEMK